MSETHWKLLVCASDVPSARLLTDMLEGEGIATRVITDAVVMGQAAPCRIFVDATQAFRARGLISQEPLSDSELTFLATGELPGDQTQAAATEAASTPLIIKTV
jgi:hypothetical protein